MKTKQEIQKCLEEERALIEEYYSGDIDDEQSEEKANHQGWTEALAFVLDEKNEQTEEVHKISASLQSYIDGVALNILYQNYHKSTNGIWSKGEVSDHWEQDGDVPEVYDVIIDFGCQDDTRNESYREEWYFFKKDGEWTCDDVSPIEENV